MFIQVNTRVKGYTLSKKVTELQLLLVQSQDELIAKKKELNEYIEKHRAFVVKYLMLILFISFKMIYILILYINL